MVHRGVLGKMILFGIAWCLASCLWACAEITTISISTNVSVSGGEIQGGYTDETQEVISYKGIPYAAPPIGDFRWRAPQDVLPWDGVKECTEFGNSAIQGSQNPDLVFTEEFIISNKTYSEDCLTLNVWTKNEDTPAQRPVLVYIHGGAWIAGGSSAEVYDGNYLASQGIVFVSVNYRLGVFGWFVHSELIAEDPEHSSGNYGLMDLIKALEWVRDNIEAFGGDKDNVTIMGQSAGSNLVNALLVSSKTVGLFKNTVSMSLNDIFDSYGNLETRKSKGDQLGTLEELRNQPAEDFVGLGFLAFLGPCKDGVVLDLNFGEALEAGRGSTINCLSGMVFSSSNKDSGDSGFLGNGKDSIDGVTNGEILMAFQNCITVARMLGDATGETYIYDFGKIMPGPNSDSISAFHTSDVPYFLNHLSPLREEYWTEEDRTVGMTASAYLINFCKTGNPNGEGLPHWSANTGDYQYLYIDTICEDKVLSEYAHEMIKYTFSLERYGGYPMKYFK